MPHYKSLVRIRGEAAGEDCVQHTRRGGVDAQPRGPQRGADNTPSNRLSFWGLRADAGEQRAHHHLMQVRNLIDLNPLREEQKDELRADARVGLVEMRIGHIVKRVEEEVLDEPERHRGDELAADRALRQPREVVHVEEIINNILNHRVQVGRRDDIASAASLKVVHLPQLGVNVANLLRNKGAQRAEEAVHRRGQELANRAVFELQHIDDDAAGGGADHSVVRIKKARRLLVQRKAVVAKEELRRLVVEAKRERLEK